MIKVLFVAPLEGNGGIVTWSANYRKVMTTDVELISIGVSKRRALRKQVNKWNILFDGLMDLKSVLKDIDSTLIKTKDARLIHMTTSGGNGTLRDYFIARRAKRNGLKCIMHCHYGCIPQDFAKRGIKGKLFHKTLRLFDQIWVLDKKSYQTLDKDSYLHGKIELVPNFLEVPASTTYTEKDFYHIGFVGNLIPSKGICELTTAVKACENTQLDIIGPGNEKVINALKEIAGDDLGTRIRLHGRVENSRAVEMMKSIDILGLPTYYPSEAFPISILEAMSLSKMVISCDRAAIPDMLTDMNGKMCGLLVAPKSTTAIEKAIKWCQNNRTEANEMCRQAYNKVYNAYRKDIIIKMCVDNYRKLL